MVNPGVHGATGRLTGSVADCRNGLLTFVSRDPVHLGDRLRIQPATDKPGTAFTIRDLRLKGKPVNRAGGGERVAVGCPPDKTFRTGDRIYKVSAGQAFNLSRSACHKRLESVTPGESVIALRLDMPSAGRIDLAATCHGVTLSRTYPVEAFPAKDRPLSREVLAKVFGKTGPLPIALGHLECGPLPAVVVPLSRLNAVRREFYRELADLIEERRQQARTDHRREAMADLVPVGATPAELTRLAVVLGQVHDLALLKQDGIDELILPLTPGVCARLESGPRVALKNPERILWDLPLAIFDSGWPDFQAEVNRLIGHGFKRFRLQNLGQFQLFEGRDGLSLESGYRLFTTNSQAAVAWREIGIVAATLYVEDDRDNLGAVLTRDTGLPLAVTVYANLPMMVSRIALRGVKPDRPLVSDRDQAYRVDDRSGLTVVRPEQDFSLLGHLGELRALGCRRFVIDLAHLGAASAEGRRVLAAYAQDAALPETSTFNYLQEMI
jgi:putative protease